MYDGVCHQTINGHPLKLGSGQVLLIDTDVPHSTEVLRGDNILSHFFINAINENANMNLSEVAHEIGYENLSFFNKKFREHHQCSPKEYRKSEASSNTRKEV